MVIRASRALTLAVLCVASVCLAGIAAPGGSPIAAAGEATGRPSVVLASARAAADDAAPGYAAWASAGMFDEEAVPAGLSPDVLHLAVSSVGCAVASGDIAPPPTLTIIDYSRPSTEPRLWVFDAATGSLLFKELVAHGKGSGENMAVRFSDDEGSLESSLGLFVGRETYDGRHGYSLRLDGLEPGFNGRARERAIVVHGAEYVSADVAGRQGRLGRSWGCPALRQAIAHQVIDTLRDGGVIFSYYPDQAWLRESRFLHCSADATRH